MKITKMVTTGRRSIYKFVGFTNNIEGVKGLSKIESFLLRALSSENKSLLTIADIIRTLGCKPNYARKLAHGLAKKKWLIKVGKGVYLIVPLSAGIHGMWTVNEHELASYLAKPCFISYWSALAYHNLTEQIPYTVFVSTLRSLKKREVLGIRYKFIKVSSSNFFGLQDMRYQKPFFFNDLAKTPHTSDTPILVSDRERTIIDCLDKPEHCGGISEVAKGLYLMKENVSVDKLIEYAATLGNGVVFKRLGYLLTNLKMPCTATQIATIEKNITKGYSVLDPLGIKKGSYDSRWNLRINTKIDVGEELKT